MSGIAMIVIDPSSVASSTASVAFDSAIHLYRSAPISTGTLNSLPVGIGLILDHVPVHQAATAELARELRETVGRFVRRLRAEPGPPVAQMTVLGRLAREGAATVSDLAGAERMRPQSMAPI